MRSLVIGAVLAAFATVPAHADTMVLSQIAPIYNSSSIFGSQDFESAYNSYDVGVVDDFHLASAFHLTGIAAVVGGFNDFGGMGGITGYRAEFYSSRAAAGNSLTGDIASVLFAPGQVTTSSYSTGSLVSAALSLDLAAGDYFVSFIPVNSYGTNGQVGIAMNGAGSGNAFQANPGRGFGFGATTSLNAAAAYSLTGIAAVPEPGTWGLMILGFGMVGGAMRRRRETISVRCA